MSYDYFLLYVWLPLCRDTWHNLSASTAAPEYTFPFFPFHSHYCLPELNKNPVEGFSAGLVDEDNLYRWEVMILGPPDTV